jgi:hypothetical protein
MITESQTGAVLFLGRVVKPQDPGPAKEEAPRPER